MRPLLAVVAGGEGRGGGGHGKGDGDPVPRVVAAVDLMEAG